MRESASEMVGCRAVLKWVCLGPVVGVMGAGLNGGVPWGNQSIWFRSLWLVG